MVTIRAYQENDLPRLVEIYNHYIANSHFTFNAETVTLEQRREWAKQYCDRGPHRIFVAAEGARVLGCAYSSVYRAHPAFRETVETSIYVDPEARGLGIGTKLYEALFAMLTLEPVHLAVAGIALPNEASVQLHKRMGFREVGVFQDYAKVKGKYFSSLWLQRLSVDRFSVTP